MERYGKLRTRPEGSRALMSDEQVSIVWPMACSMCGMVGPPYSPSPASQVSIVWSAFKAFDEGNHGKLDAKHFGRALAEMGHPRADDDKYVAKSMKKILKANNRRSDEFTFNEFLEFVADSVNLMLSEEQSARLLGTCSPTLRFVAHDV